MRHRWSSVCKNPDIGMKQEQAGLTLAPWPLVNHMSPAQVNYIVTKKVLKLDQDSCKHVLESMLEERRADEKKLSIQMLDRSKLRERLRTSHNNTVLLEQRVGVKNAS